MAVKALHGCIPSSQIYKSYLEGRIFKQLPTGTCIFWWIFKMMTCFLILYVDNTSLFANDDEVNQVD